MSDTASVHGSDLFGVGGPPVIPGYTPEHKLGQGGFGAVWLAKDAQGHSVAVKVAHAPGHSLDRESRCLQVLYGLPFVPAYVAQGLTDDGRAYLVQEFVAGEPLDIQAKRTADEVEALMVRLLNAVDGLHTATRERLGAVHVHADLKPGNILLTKDGRTVLLDLGAARKVKDDGHTTGQVGVVSHGYGAPEVYAGRQPTERSDVYSLGVIAFEMLTGTRMADPVAYVRQTQALEALDRACQERKALALAIRKALSPEPEERFRSAGEFVAFLENPWQAELGLSAAATLTPAPDVPHELALSRRLRRIRTASLFACTLAVGWFGAPLALQAALAKAAWAEQQKYPSVVVAFPKFALAVAVWGVVALVGRMLAWWRAKRMSQVAHHAVVAKDYPTAEACFREVVADGGKAERSEAQKAILWRTKF